MKRILVVVGLASALFPPAVAGATAPSVTAKIAIVDAHRAVEASSKGKAALAAVDRSALDHLQQQRVEVAKQSQDLDKSKGNLKPDVYANEQRELVIRSLKVDLELIRAKDEAQEKQNQALAPIRHKVTEAAAQIAARDHYTLVIDSASVIWPAQGDIDITNDVMQIVDRGK